MTPMREAITPGRLYARMSQDFRRQRTCSWCRLPLPQLTIRTHDAAPNWELALVGTECRSCEHMIRALISRYQERFDLNDPVAIPRRPQPHGPQPRA